ncbi:MAG TPA: hypothetical protein VLS96_08985, partial [Nodosilinea sp.]|nr:hypothetical protein [Nodosilinea sp.]
MNRHLLRRALRFPKAAIKRLVTGLLQLVLLANRPARLARAGFVLPTTVLLVLMVVLTATALTYRSFTRSDMAISQREQQVISNAATPAIDRAKAKIEFLFQTDNRFPSGVPASDILADLMLVSDGFAGYTGRVSQLAGADDPYTLPDETRVDINGDGDLDNAWSFNADLDSNGTADPNEIIVYSILVDDQGPEMDEDVSIEDPVNQAKADALVTRTGPLATTEASPACAGALAEGGWQVVQQGNNSILQKNFQVNAFVANLNDANRTFETLEFQQSRSAARANKWGAWFRYDLDISPTPEFNWNGAMHTDGSLFTFGNEGTNPGKGLRAHMVSSHNSCLYSQDASEISLSEIDLNGDNIANPRVSVNGVAEFQGQAVRGTMRYDNTSNGGASIIHVWDGRDEPAITTLTLANDTDSVRTDDGNNNARPSDIAMNPLALFARDVTQHINPDGWERDPDWDTEATSFSSDAYRRIINDEVTRPFVDDFYRADNRWGPKPRYDSRDTSLDIANAPAGTTIGSDIDSLGKLTDTEGGLDGYWERQSIVNGLRLIVGQRLELGNSNGWNLNRASGSADATNAAGDPLYPAIATSPDVRYGRSHEYLQRKALRDNLAAVQGMTVYHYQINGGTFPAACMAMTAHPGTAQSIINSRTFERYPVTTTVVKTDFLNGKGTNGWEFRYPAAFNTEATFADEIVSTQPLGKALRNLAYFAGDPDGGAPSFVPVQDANNVHPAPYLNMWGDFSPLRRIFRDYLDASPAVAYDDLSPADKATLHSAACTISILAHNVSNDIAEYTAIAGDNLTSIGESFWKYLDPGNNGGSNFDLSNFVGTTYRKFPNNSSIYPNEDIVLTKGIRTRANWTDPTPTGTCPSGAADAPGFQVGCDEAEYYNQFSAED